MEIVDRKPVPVYEAVCSECKSTIRYKACEVDYCVIKCPVCSKIIWASICNPVAYEESEEVSVMPDREKKQEHVKPIFDEKDVSGRCGVCGHALTHQSMVGNVLVDEWFQYCPICGRKVDWIATD